MRSVLRFSLGAGLMASSLGVAQEAGGPTSYPAEFVHALMDVDDVDLLVAEIPESVEERVPWPAEIRLLGSWRHESATTVMGLADVDAESLRSGYTSKLKEAGWIALNAMNQRGFISPEEQPLGHFCRAGQSILVFIKPLTDQSARLKTTVYEGDVSSGCNPPPDRRPDPYDGVPFPRLTPPTELRLSTGRASSSGPGWQEEEVVVVTDMPAARIAQHFGAQMLEAGWQSVGYCQDGSLSLESYEMIDDQERQWLAHLSVLEESGEEPRKSLRLRVTTADRDRFYR